MRRVLETAMLLMGTLGFWGFVYPEFCFTQETCEVAEQEEKNEEIDIDEFFSGEKEVRIKSRVFEYVYQVKEKAYTEKDYRNDR